ncbi:MAG: site-2 protease family protein [Candidatus Bathyarchaeota archaeon]|jgi:Zn-dependent protease|nr:site-2 protease family protein [Candidatus Bathyarchaeota archaeon]
MVKCDHCGDEVYLPFRCSYCGGYYCSKHRLPEFHDCTGLHRRAETYDVGRATSSRRYDSYRAPRRGLTLLNLLKFSNKELRDLGISLAVISALSLYVMWQNRLLFRMPLVVLGAVGIFAAAFLLHELAHKFAAQRFGLWAEYRINNFGLMITLLSFVSPFKLVAPGAVVIAGLMYGDEYGKIALAGPLTNIAQAIVYLFIMLLSQNPVVALLAYLGITINASLALFNLLPFGVFDGVKVLRWDWRAWVSATVVAGLLYLYSPL